MLYTVVFIHPLFIILANFGPARHDFGKKTSHLHHGARGINTRWERVAVILSSQKTIGFPYLLLSPPMFSTLAISASPFVCLCILHSGIILSNFYPLNAICRQKLINEPSLYCLNRIPDRLQRKRLQTAPY